MKRARVTGMTCVGDLRLAAIDVGYDLRTAGHAVFLPDQFGSVGLDANGQTWLIEGTREEMIEAIKEAGYTIREPREYDVEEEMRWEDE